MKFNLKCCLLNAIRGRTRSDGLPKSHSMHPTLGDLFILAWSWIHACSRSRGEDLLFLENWKEAELFAIWQRGEQRMQIPWIRLLVACRCKWPGFNPAIVNKKEEIKSFIGFTRPHPFRPWEGNLFGFYKLGPLPSEKGCFIRQKRRRPTSRLYDQIWKNGYREIF